MPSTHGLAKQLLFVKIFHSMFCQLFTTMMGIITETNKYIYIYLSFCPFYIAKPRRVRIVIQNNHQWGKK
jgi:hypothetical protein